MVQNKAGLSIFLFLLVFLSSSCSSEKSIFYGINTGKKPAVKYLLKTEKNEKMGLASYILKKPYTIEESDGPVFFRAEIAFPDGHFIFRIHTSAEEKNIEFVSSGNISAFLYFVIEGKDFLKGFSIENSDISRNIEKAYTDNKKETVLKEVRVIDRNNYFEGYSKSKNEFYQSENFQSSADSGKITLTFTPVTSNSLYPVNRLTINTDSASSAESNNYDLMELSSNSLSRIISVLPVKGVISITAADLSEIIPGLTAKDSFRLKLSYEDNKNNYKTITVSRKNHNLSSLAAIEADFGTILDYNRDKWRNDRYELFAWSIFPEFLTIDTADYNFQNAMFKRLAFFVEKPSTAGRLLTDTQLEGLHGWNAHDYKAEDLCDFFNLADKTGFLLSQEEQLLGMILLENGIIKKTESAYQPVRGGILSISRESNQFLRKVFISHEGYHGVFFASKAFREKCAVIWNDVSPDVKKFWHFFLAHKNYDISNNYLVVNEFMAYNLQQPPERVEPYFFDYIIPALYNNYPKRRDFLDLIRESALDEFIAVSEKISEALNSVTGLPPGNLVFIKKHSAAPGIAPKMNNSFDEKLSPADQ